jgi:hypothetical protein
LGSRLDLAVARRTGANFLTRNIFNQVELALDSSKVTGALISEPRIWNNLLSSQPLAFNLFGELATDLNLATGVFRSLECGTRIEQITRAEFEFSPGRGNPKYTNDRTAFDVFFEFITVNGSKGFIGIEVKYAESMDGNTSQHRPHYENIASCMGVFEKSCLPKLQESPLQQIWRDHLLVGSLLVNGDYEEGFLLFLYPAQNISCASAIDSYQSTLRSQDSGEHGFYVCTMEQFHLILSKLSDAQWVKQFYERYLDFEGKVKSILVES